MSLSVVTWNINSVRLRIGLVTRLLQHWQPDVLCLQETKCPQGQFPSGPIRDLGYEATLDGVRFDDSRLSYTELNRMMREIVG